MCTGLAGNYPKTAKIDVLGCQSGQMANSVLEAKTEGFEYEYLLKRLKIADFEYIDSNLILRYKKLWGKEIKEPASLQNYENNTVVIITAIIMKKKYV